MKKALGKTQQEIMQLMVSIAQKDRFNAERQIQEIRVLIYEGVDYATDDEDIIRWSKFMKIVEELEAKL